MKLKKVMTAICLTAACAVIAIGCGKSDKKDTSESGQAQTEETGEKGADFDPDSEISVVSREEGSGTRGAFIELTGLEEKQGDKKIDLTYEGAQITNNTSVMMTTVAEDDYAVGYISLGSLNDSVKAVKVDGAEATAENIKAGTYKLSRPFQIAVKEGASNPVAEDLIAFILSDEGQKIVADNGYISVDTKGSFSTSKPEGKAVVAGSSSVSPVMEKLIEGYKAVNDKAEIELLTSDSTTGMTSAIDGSCDIGMASRELKDSELSKGLVPTAIAIDGIAVVVNNNNPVEGLTVDQIRSIFAGETTMWSDVN